MLPPHATAALRNPTSGPAADNPAQPIQRVVLAGNPNVGKSVVFNALTGLYTNVSNFPGTTVDIPKGVLPDDKTIAIEDTPGVMGLSGLTDEETVAEAAIITADVVVNVINAASLGRDLFLTQQLLDYGLPLVIVLNQMDMAEATGQRVDTTKLADILGVPVIPTIATCNDGLASIPSAFQSACIGNPTPGASASQGKDLQQLEADPAQRMHCYGIRRQHVNAIVSQVVTNTTENQQSNWRQKVSHVLGQAFLHPVFGAFSLLVVLLALYQIVGVWVAGDIVDFTEGTIMLGWVVPAIQGVIANVFPTGSLGFNIMAGEFGVLTMSLQYIYGVLFPLVLGFYIYISVLEDSGYLPRIAVLSDTLLSRVGLNGRAIIPIILGFGCVTMATVSTRVLSSQRERTIASTLLAVTIPCSAQLAVIMALMASAGGLTGWLTYLGFLFAVFTGLGAALNAVLPGKSTPLLLDLPPVRLPQVNNVAKKTWVRTQAFIAEAAPLFVLGSAIVAVLDNTGLLKATETALAPLTVWVLDLPGETATAFVMGMVRRDFGAAGLLTLGATLTPAQVLTALMTITLFVPCIASAAIFWKERGWQEASTILIGSWVIAFGVGAIVARILGGVTALFPGVLG